MTKKIQNCVYYLSWLSSVYSIEVCNLFRQNLHKNTQHVTAAVCMLWYFLPKSQEAATTISSES